jgi:RNA polymerase sigma-54 factor
LKLELELKAAQTVTPQMIGTMTILQYGVQELENYLRELSWENPMAELSEPAAEPEPVFGEKLRWLRQYDRQNVSYYSASEDPRQWDIPDRSAQNTLSAFVQEQLLTLPLSPEKRRVMTMISQLLDQRGFFTGTTAELSQLCHVSPKTAQDALIAFRQLEPPGVGTENVRESLICQLSRLPEDTQLARTLLSLAEPQLSGWPIARLAKRLQVSEAALKRAENQILSLHPYPADGFASEEQTIYIQPDLRILVDQNGLRVQSCQDYLPELRVNSQYLKMLETQTDPEVTRYLRQKLQQVEQVLHDLTNRTSTMIRCGQIIAQHQADFFLGGSLHTLTLRDVAEEMDVHESTVSRTIKGKYIQCPQGILPMSAFFSRCAGQNQSLSRQNIQVLLSDLIAQEDPQRPYSDQQLSQKLGAQNVILSRRAVAKYRAELGILPAHVRKAVV